MMLAIPKLRAYLAHVGCGLAEELGHTLHLHVSTLACRCILLPKHQELDHLYVLIFAIFKLHL